MNELFFFFLIALMIVFLIVVVGYLHKRHKEYHMSDIEHVVRSVFVQGVNSVEKPILVKAVKGYFHCSSKEALYIIGVARRKKLINILEGNVTLL